jgi:hypothetical protein
MGDGDFELATGNWQSEASDPASVDEKSAVSLEVRLVIEGM